MNRDSGSEQPGQRTVAELLAEYGGSSGKSGTRRRRRRAEDPTETAPHAIIDRVMSDSGTMRAVDANGNPVPSRTERTPPQAASQPPPAPPQQPAAQQPGPAPAAQQPGPAAQQPGPAPAAQQPGPAAQQPGPAAQQPGPAPAAQPPGPAPSAQPQPPAAPPQQPAAQTPGPAPTQPPAAPSASQRPTAAPQRPAPPPSPQEAPAGQGAPDAPASDEPAEAGNVWSQRFAAATGGAQAAPPARNAASPIADQEQTTRQPALARATEEDSGHTEQIPRVAAAPAEPDTKVVPVPSDDPYASSGDLSQAGGNADYDDPYDVYGAQSYGADTAYPGTQALTENPYPDDQYADERYGEDQYGGDQYAEDGYGDADHADDYDPELPAGMGTRDYGEDDDPEQEQSPGREWAMFAVQMGAGVLGGGLVWVGFRWLWINIPVAALVAALVVTGCLVLLARKFLRGDDVQTILLAVLAGLFCTVSPATLLLVGQ